MLNSAINFDRKEIRIKKVISVSWSVLKENFVAFLALAAIGTLPTVFIPDPKHSALPLFLVFGIVVVSMICSLISGMAASVAVERIVSGKDVQVVDAVKAAFSKLGSAITTLLLSTLIIFGMYLLLIIPGIVWTVYYLFVMQAVVLRNIKNTEALSYSKKLVKGNWWNIILAFFLCGVIMVIILMPFIFVVGLINSGLLFDIFSLVLNTVCTAFSVVLMGVMFLALERIKNTEVCQENIAGK